MKDDPGRQAVRRLQTLVQRETGAPLRHDAEREMAEIVRRARGLGPDPDEQVPFESREVTILLADLRGFTAISASEPAGRVIELLNRCLGCMSEVVFRHHGMIDKFMGDSIMVLFGAPVERDDDVARALTCSIEMQIAMQEFNAQGREDDLPALYMGIGINTGNVMAGRFGTAAYSEYTVIGDEVNLASRIEAFSLRGQVLISEATYRRCDALVEVSEPMEVYVKGKPQPVRLRELLSMPARGLIVPRQETRRSHRADVRLPCTLQRIQNKIVVPRMLRANVRDIGYHGALLELTEPLEPHAEVKLEFDLPLVDFRVDDIYAKVVNVKAEGRGLLAGLEFTSVGPASNAKIQLFVQFLVGTH